MSRPPLEPIAIKALPDIFTALLAIALVALLVGTGIVIMQAMALFKDHPIWG